MSHPPLGIVLAEAPRLVRAGIAMLFDRAPDMELLAEAGDAAGCLDGIRRLRVRSNIVVVVGLGVAGRQDSFWLIRSIRDRFPTLPVVACAADADENTISRAFFMGADSFVDKDSRPEDLLTAVRRTAVGEVVLEGVPAAWMPTIASSVEHQGLVPPTLTDREVEVLSVAVDGMTARQIARQLGLQERTVTTHFSRIYRKLGVTSRVAAISTARRSGVLVSASG